MISKRGWLTTSDFFLSKSDTSLCTLLSEAAFDAFLKVMETFDDDLEDEDSGEEDEDVKPELPPPLGQEATAQTIQPMDGE